MALLLILCTVTLTAPFCFTPWIWIAVTPHFTLTLRNFLPYLSQDSPLVTDVIFYVLCFIGDGVYFCLFYQSRAFTHMCVLSGASAHIHSVHVRMSSSAVSNTHHVSPTVYIRISQGRSSVTETLSGMHRTSI